MPTLSVLMSVYQKTDAHELTAALDSLLHQTRPADEVLIVEDGPLTAALYEVLDQHCERNPSSRRLPLATNQGLGAALQAGLATIDADFVARLDSDDYAAPERFSKQLACFAADPSVDVVGSAVAEFYHEPGDTDHVRSLPETHAAIRRYAKINNPINHPSVMMRTAAVTAVGGYQSVHFMEDYDLFARLLARGYRFYNIPEPLTFFRVSDDQFQRRTGAGMWASERQLQRNLISYKLISRPRAVVNFFVRMGYRKIPRALLKRVYSLLFHRPTYSVKPNPHGSM
ncbi:MAG: glycosyltransferase [Corynebacterium sp.]|nr:glycosyltransferase [Corynebacterium sp.]